MMTCLQIILEFLFVEMYIETVRFLPSDYSFHAPS
jgi:hypothetical protein